MQVRFSDMEVSHSARGIPTFRVELWHDGLKKHRQIRGSERVVVDRKARMQAAEWKTKWEESQKKEAGVKARADRKQYQEDQKALAVKRTNEAQANLEALERTLERTLSIDDAIDWDKLKDKSPFPEAPPVKI